MLVVVHSSGALSHPTGYAGNAVAGNARPTEINERANAAVSLVSLLAQLQSFYQVTFNYDSDILEGIVTNEDAISLKTKKVTELEANLEVLLHPEGLKYERSRKDIYLIYSEEKNQKQLSLPPVPGLQKPSGKKCRYPAK